MSSSTRVSSHQLVDPARDDPADLLARARAGDVVVVVGPPDSEAWREATGVRPLDRAEHAEVVVEPTADPLARNLPGEHVHRGGVHPVAVLGDTRSVLRTRLSYGEQSVAAVRTHGEGAVVTLGQVPDPDLQPDPDPLATVLARVTRGVTPPSDELGIGIVGYGQHGGMGWLHATASEQVEGLHLAAIAETNPGRLEDAGTRFPDAALHTDIAGLLADDAVDVVVIATPPSTHHLLSRQALEAGRHVVVEKPLCFTAAEADDLLATAADVDRVLTVHQNRRWDADYRAIRRLVAEGTLGEVFNIETFVGGFEHPCRLWHSEVSVSGGRLYDWGAHLIDQQLRLFDAQPLSVTSTGHGRVWDDVTNLDQVRVRLRFDDGREAEFLDSDVLAVRRPKYVVQGTAGTLVGHYRPVVEETVTPERGHERVEHHHAEGPARLQLALHQPGWGLHEVDVPVLPAPSQPFHRALADHLQLGDPVPVDAHEIRDLVAVLHAAHTSAHGGGTPVTPA
jgi:predicted dehydrogenase